MGPEIISYTALAGILLAGAFIIRAGFKLHEKNYPLEAGEEVLFEEFRIKFHTVVGENKESHYFRFRIRITNKRMYIYSHGRYLFTLIYLDEGSEDNNRDELKGVIHVPRSAFKVEMDEKSQRLLLTMERVTLIGVTIRYVFGLADAHQAVRALRRS